MQDEGYINNTGLSGSSLKDFEWMSPRIWKETYLDKTSEKENKLHFNKGSYLDSLMLNPDNIEESFYIGDFKSKISESIQTIVDSIYKKLLKEYQSFVCHVDFSNVEDETINKIIVEYANYANYGNGNYKDDRIIKEIREKGKEYFDFLCIANGRIIISMQDQLLALDKKSALLNTNYTAPYFMQQKDELLYHHLQIFVDGLKGELDILRIVPKEKTIYIPDLKTSHSSFQFMENVRKFSYATQLGFYKHLVKLLFSGAPTVLNKEVAIKEEFFNYKIICQNIVIDEKSMKPMIYQYSDEDLDYYEYGSEVMKNIYPNIRYRRGWKNTLEIIKWHIANDKWDLSKGHYEKGHILIDLINGRNE